MTGQNALTALVVLWVVIVALLIVLVVDTIRDERREQGCAAMGETWQNAIELPDGARMPGQCVDLGVRA